MGTRVPRPIYLKAASSSLRREEKGNSAEQAKPQVERLSRGGSEKEGLMNRGGCKGRQKTGWNKGKGSMEGRLVGRKKPNQGAEDKAVGYMP